MHQISCSMVNEVLDGVVAGCFDGELCQSFVLVLQHPMKVFMGVSFRFNAMPRSVV